MSENDGWDVASTPASLTPVTHWWLGADDVCTPWFTVPASFLTIRFLAVESTQTLARPPTGVPGAVTAVPMRLPSKGVLTGMLRRVATYPLVVTSPVRGPNCPDGSVPVDCVA